MFNTLFVSLVIPSFFAAGFICPPTKTSLQPIRHQFALTPLPSSASNEETKGGGFELFSDETDETLLRINFSCPRESSVTVALDAVRQYTKSFPFAAVLPVQPLTYLPVQMPDGSMALKVTFLRKKTEEKDSKDGGILFQCEEAPKDVPNTDEDDDSQKIELVAKRISKGQTVSKVFSEKLIVTAFVKGLDEERGKEILKDANVSVESLFHPWMLE